MKPLTITLFFILLLGCSPDPEPADTSNNVCFYSSGVSYDIQIKGIIGGQKTIFQDSNYPNPSCATVCPGGCGFLSMYLKEGNYDIVVLTPSGSVIKKITTTDGGCIMCDMNNLSNW